MFLNSIFDLRVVFNVLQRRLLSVLLASPMRALSICYPGSRFVVLGNGLLTSLRPIKADDVTHRPQRLSLLTGAVHLVAIFQKLKIAGKVRKRCLSAYVSSSTSFTPLAFRISAETFGGTTS